MQYLMCPAGELLRHHWKLDGDYPVWINIICNCYFIFQSYYIFVLTTAYFPFDTDLLIDRTPTVVLHNYYDNFDNYDKSYLKIY